MEMMMLFGTYV